MTTIKEISKNLQGFRPYESYMYEGMTEFEINKTNTEVELSTLIKSNSKCNSHQISYSNTIISYEINNIEVLNLLRGLYKLTKNTFVKSIIETVGTTKKFSDKQISIITSEMVNFENLEINF